MGCLGIRIAFVSSLGFCVFTQRTNSNQIRWSKLKRTFQSDKETGLEIDVIAYTMSCLISLVRSVNIDITLYRITDEIRINRRTEPHQQHRINQKPMKNSLNDCRSCINW